MKRSFLLAGLLVLLSCRSVQEAAETSTARSAGAGPLEPAAAAGAWVHTPPPAPLAVTAPAAPAATRAMLPNGLRVVVVEQHGRPVVIATLILARGALADPPLQAGLTWMAVNLASDYYEYAANGEPLLEEKSFRRQVYDVGGSASFDVSADVSTIRISGYAPDARQYLRMMADAVILPRSGGHSFIGRRNAVLDAIDDLETSDPEAFKQVVSDAAFGPGHPYARPAIGTRASVAPLGDEEVISHQQEVFVPAGATLLIVGDVRPDQMIAAARASFGQWNRRAESGPPRAPPAAIPTAATDVSYLERRPASTLMVCATRPLADVQGSEAALDVLATILGHGAKSRLGSALRETNGLTYYATAQIVRRRHARAFLACSPLKSDQGDFGVQLFRDVLRAAHDAPPTAAEVEWAKSIRLAELESSWDDVFSAHYTWMRAIVTGTGTPRLEEERAELSRIRPEDVHKVAKAVLSLRSLRWVISGDRSAAARAVSANRLGQLQRLTLSR